LSRTRNAGNRLLPTELIVASRNRSFAIANLNGRHPEVRCFFLRYVRFVASLRPVMRYPRRSFDITRCSAIGRLPQRASPVTVGSEAWGTTSPLRWTPLARPKNDDSLLLSHQPFPAVVVR